MQIEFPSVLLPSNISSGSIVDIEVSRNLAAEAKSVADFQALQKRILNTYGLRTPSPPVLRLRNATQTSLVLEWDPINLATASLKSLSLYRNGSKAGSIPRPLETLSTKISGLAIDTEYTFHLVLRTTAGTYQSEKLVCRTHKMTDLSGITVTPGIMSPQQKEALARALERIGGKMVDTVRIDTTHFVCTEGRGSLWEKAVEMNIPVVRPEWVDACEAEGTIVSVRSYYLNADPRHRQLGTRPISQQVQQHRSTASTSTAPPSAPATAPAGGQPEPASQSGTEQAPEKPPTPFPGGSEDAKSQSEGERPLTPPPKDRTASPEEKQEAKAQKEGEANVKSEEKPGEGATEGAAEGAVEEGAAESHDQSEEEEAEDRSTTETTTEQHEQREENGESSKSPTEEKLDEVPL